MSDRCCKHHMASGIGACALSFFDGCEPCCDNCPTYDWDGLNGYPDGEGEDQ